MDKKPNKSDTQIQFITLSNYVRPPVVEKQSDKWVYNGVKNSFYQYILDRYNGSPSNASIINTYCDLIYGRGLMATNARENLNDWVKLKGILNPKELKKIIKDYTIYNEASLQTIKTKGGDLSTITHIEKRNVLPSLIDEDGDIPSYWYSMDWLKFRQAAFAPEEFSTFGSSKDAVEIYVIRPYSPGKIYFTDPDYLSGLMYAEMEEEIANLNISSIRQGLSAGYIINVPNGINWTPEQKEYFEKAIKAKLTGSTQASSFVISFNGLDVEVTVTPFPVNDQVHKQWETLNDTATQKILTSHRCTSPSIVGIVSSSGFSNTADEMDTAEKQLVKRVIKPKQDDIINALQEILVFYNINLDLYFAPLTEDVTPTQLSAQHGAQSSIADKLIKLGEDFSEDDWILIADDEVNYDTDDEVYELIKMANTGTARPNAKSTQDSDDIVIRYRYVGNKSPQREFCRKMMLADKRYRKEDILLMGEDGDTNKGFGMAPFPNRKYSIWLWKGGGKRTTTFPNGTCRHKWNRVIYLKRGGGVDVNSPLAKQISTIKSRARGYKVPVNDTRVSIAPHDMKI